MAVLNIKRAGSIIATVQIGKDTVYQGQLMGENKIVARFASPAPLGLQVGDYIEYRGQEWRLNTPVSDTRQSSNKIEYDVVFEGREYTWHNKKVRHLGRSDFSFFGTPAELLQLIVDNINEIDAGWLVGTVDTAEPQLFTFDRQSCATALSTIAESFNLEYEFAGRTIHLKATIGTVVSGVTLSYGKGNGLYTLSRQAASDASLATRVYGFGGTQNIPASYRGGQTRLTFEGGKVDNNISLYGIIEDVVYFDHIFPKRTAAITGTGSPVSVTDTTLDFDLNSVIIQGQAKIHFKTGDLSGKSFEITGYDHGTKTISFKADTEESGYIIPNATVKPATGDLYTLHGIEMPATYITAAETELAAETAAYADKIKTPLVTFGLNIDQLAAKANGLDVSLKLGDKLHTVDVGMGVDTTLRVQSITYPIISPAQISASIGDKVTYTRGEQLRKVVAKQEEEVRKVTKTAAELGRINAIRREELKNSIFDPEGYFDSEHIKPLSIETMHLAVGSRSQDFTLTSLFKPNYNGNPNEIYWTDGSVTHFTIEETVRSWTIVAGSATGLTTGSPYYIYVRATRVGTSAVIIVDTAQRKVDSDPSYYYFLVGILSSVIDGVRIPTLTYGYTEIDGKFIKTGKISSFTGSTYFDLENNEIGGTIKFRAADTTLKDVTVVEAAAATAQGTADTAVSNAAAAQATANEAKGVTDNFTVISGGLISSNTIKLGTLAQDVAGVTGVGTAADSIRFWAGQSYANRASAPFRVDQSGNLVATNATISGNITATSGTIGGVTINANDLFTLNGSKVEILPNSGIKVFGSGYADFTNAILKVPTVAPSGLASGEAALWIGSLSGVASGVSGGSVATLSDVALTGLASGQILVWNGATWVNQNNVAAVDLSGYYTKTETQNFFSGASSMSGYNKSNWDSAYAASHSHANKAFLDGITSGATVGINISGNAANATQWNGNSYFGPLTGSISLFMISTGTGFGTMTLSQVQSGLGLGSAAYTASSAYYAAGSTVANSTQWGGQTYNGSVAATIQYALVYDNTNAQFRLATASNLQSFLGLGSNAYSSTAYLPLSGGTLSGALYATALYDNGSRVLSQRGNSYYQVDTWLQLNGTYALYFPSSGSGSHFCANGGYETTTYGSFQLAGFKSGYIGLTFLGTAGGSGTATHPATVMFDAAGNGGTYNGGTWHYYYGVTHGCLSIGGTTTYAGYKAAVNGSLRITGQVYCDTYVESAGYFYSNYGMYNPANGLYFGQPIGNAGWYLKSNHTNVQVQLRTSDNNVRGYLYADTGNNIGFLHNGGGWVFQAWSGATQTYGTSYVTGDVIAFYSDIRLKTIKGNITNALAMLHQVSGVYYEANDHAISIGAVKEKKNEVGLIAQQWAGIMPEVLALAPFDMDGNGGSKSGMNYMTMKYERTVPLIIEAVKEVDNKYTREIAALKQRVAELERRLN